MGCGGSKEEHPLGTPRLGTGTDEEPSPPNAPPKKDPPKPDTFWKTPTPVDKVADEPANPGSPDSVQKTPQETPAGDGTSAEGDELAGIHPGLAGSEPHDHHRRGSLHAKHVPAAEGAPAASPKQPTPRLTGFMDEADEPAAELTFAESGMISSTELMPETVEARMTSDSLISTFDLGVKGMTMRYAHVWGRGFYPETPDKNNQDAFKVGGGSLTRPNPSHPATGPPHPTSPSSTPCPLRLALRW